MKIKHALMLYSMSEPHQILGKNIIKLRMEKQLTQEALAEKAEISHRYLQAIEAGKKQPSINVVSRIRFGLGCPWEELVRGL